MIDAKELEAIAEAAADNIVEIIEAMGLKPSKKAKEPVEAGAEGRLPDETVLEIYDTMPQEVKDYMRGHYGDETWAAYEADIERMRGEQGAA